MVYLAMEFLYNYLNKINLLVFHFFNINFGTPTFNEIAIFLDRFGGPHYFYYHFTLIIITASIIFYQQRHNKKELKEFFILGASAGICLTLSIILELLIIAKGLKEYTNSSRPYCSLNDIYIIPEIIDPLSCNRSFPSGHLTFSIILVTSFWTLLNRTFKFISIIFVILVAISRMSSGAHYPVDLLGATIICLPITIYIKRKSDIFVRYYEKHWNIFEHIYKYILKYN